MKEARYFYVQEAQHSEELPQEEATHALRVLRLKAGDEIFLMDGCGAFHRAEVTLATNKRCLYSIIESMPQEPIWHGHLHLAMAPTKMMDRVEWTVEKATEIGFDELSMLDCKFSERHQVRKDRIEKIVISAAKQSRKAWMPKVNEMESFKDFIVKPRQGLKFICHCYEEFEKTDLFQHLQNTLKTTDDKECDVTILVGPEGDFSVEEVQMALDNGYISTSLGTSRLRTETAGLMAVAMANIILRKQ